MMHVAYQRVHALDLIPLTERQRRLVIDGSQLLEIDNPPWTVDSFQHVASVVWSLANTGLGLRDIQTLLLDPESAVYGWTQTKGRAQAERAIARSFEQCIATDRTHNVLRIDKLAEMVRRIILRPRPKSGELTERHRRVLLSLLEQAAAAGKDRGFSTNHRTLKSLSGSSLQFISSAVLKLQKHGLIKVVSPATATDGQWYSLNHNAIHEYFSSVTRHNACGVELQRTVRPVHLSKNNLEASADAGFLALMRNDPAAMHDDLAWREWLHLDRLVTDSAGLGPVLSGGGGARAAMYAVLTGSGGDPVTVARAAELSGVPAATARTALEFLRGLGLADRQVTAESQGRRGRPSFEYFWTKVSDASVVADLLEANTVPDVGSSQFVVWSEMRRRYRSMRLSFRQRRERTLALRHFARVRKIDLRVKKVSVRELNQFRAWWCKRDARRVGVRRPGRRVKFPNAPPTLVSAA